MNRREDSRVRSLVSRILWTLAGAAFVSVGIVKALGSYGIGIPYPMVVLLLLVLVVPFVLVRRIEEQRIPPTMFEDPVIDRSFPEADDAVRVAVSRWDLRLEYRQDDLTPARILADLVSERLRLVHGVDVAADPERVRRLVGPNVWLLLTQAPRPMPAHVLAGMITEMEAL